MAQADIYLPDEELRKAYDLGSEAAKEGKSKNACPFVIPAMQDHWNAGYEAIKEWLGELSQ